MKTVLRILMLSVAFLTGAAPLCAQKQRLQNIPYIDQRRVHYGFMLGLTAVDANFEHAPGAEWFAEAPNVDASFCVGLLGDLALTEHLSLRCTPSLYFQTREVTLRHLLAVRPDLAVPVPDPETGEALPPSVPRDVRQSVRSTYMELPITLKVSTRRLNNYRPYMALGVGLWYDWGHEKETPLVFNRWDVGLHVAMGCDGYLPFFKFCPELRFNWGLLDMLDHKRAGLKDPTLMQYTDAITRARNKSVSLIFYFE